MSNVCFQTVYCLLARDYMQVHAKKRKTAITEVGVVYLDLYKKYFYSLQGYLFKRQIILRNHTFIK